MTRILYNVTHGPEDPTRATMPFHYAAGALQEGFGVQLLLSGDAAVLMQDGAAVAVQAAGKASLPDLIATLVAGGAEFYV